MARPWPKKSKWPYVAKNGRRSYVVGFYDHDRRERCRTFPSVRHARAWMDGYITAERRGRKSLRRFLLDLDAREANEFEAHTIGQVLELYLQVKAHPSNPGGLAPTTYERYQSLIRLHMLDRPRGHGSRLKPPRAYAVTFCSLPAVRFNQPRAPSAWRELMLREGVPKSTRKQAWNVLSAALSWAASSQLIPEIETRSGPATFSFAWAFALVYCPMAAVTGAAKLGLLRRSHQGRRHNWQGSASRLAVTGIVGASFSTIRGP